MFPSLELSWYMGDSYLCDGLVVQLLSLGYVRVKIVPEEKVMLKCAFLLTPWGTVGASNGCVSCCFPAFLGNLHGKFPSGKSWVLLSEVSDVFNT